MAAAFFVIVVAAVFVSVWWLKGSLREWGWGDTQRSRKAEMQKLKINEINQETKNNPKLEKKLITKPGVKDQKR